jgi:hypothetical protein
MVMTSIQSSPWLQESHVCSDASEIPREGVQWHGQQKYIDTIHFIFICLSF